MHLLMLLFLQLHYYSVPHDTHIQQLYACSMHAHMSQLSEPCMHTAGR